MSPTNDTLLSRLTVRLKNSFTAQVIGSGVLFPVKDKVYVLTAAHCLYADRDGFSVPLGSVTLDVYAPVSDTYMPLELVIDYQLVSPFREADVAVLVVDRAVVEALAGMLPVVEAVAERQSATTFVVKGFPNATLGRELDLIRPVWKQEMTETRRFQLQLDENYSAWATAGFSGSGVFLHTHYQVYLYGIFTRFRPEEMGKVIYAQFLETVNTLLSANWLRPIPFAFFGQHGLNASFFNGHIETAVKNLGPRFNEKLNLKMPISKLFNVIAKDERFKRSVLGVFDTYLSVKDYASYDTANEQVKPVDAVFKDLRPEIAEWLAKLPWQPGVPMDFDFVTDLVEALNELITDKRAQLYEMRREKQKTEVRNERDYSYRPPYERELDRLYTIGSANDELLNGIYGASLALADSPFLLIKGEAGCGKSHMLGDIATVRARVNKPSLLLLGQLFKKEYSVWKNIFEQLQVSCTKEELLTTLNDIGRQIGSRVLILVDALNEGDGKAIWPNELAGFISEVGRYPYIGLVLTVRSVYWDAVVPKPVQADPKITKITHEGFRGNEYAALKLFCAYYGLQQPNFPILAPEYGNPLFLQLVCEGVQASPGKKFPQGFQGISRLFGFYLQSVNRKLVTRREEYAMRTKLAEEAILELARASFAKQSRSLSLDEAVTLFDTRFPAHRMLLNDLIQENVFIQSLRHNYATDTDEDVVYFSYERFGDFFIAKELLKDYQNAAEVTEAFRPGTPLAQLLVENYYLNTGILEALAVVLPEQFGLEITEVFGWAFTATEEHTRWIASQWLNHWLLDSLKWRSAESVDAKKLSTWFNSEYFTTDFHQFLNAILELVPVQGHPYNSDRMQEFFSGFSMAERDGFLQQFFYYYQGTGDNDSPYPLRRLIEWSWQPGISALIDEETARLTGQCLAWVLSSTHRKLRDQATKAMVNLLEEQPKALIAILKAFAKVDDAYIQERLYAVAYGCALRTSADGALLAIAQYVYNAAFAKGNPPAQILLRDYARNTVEYAAYKGLALKADLARIRPPYHSPMPEMPSEEDIAVYEMDHAAEGFRENHGHEYNRIHFSVTAWDFSRYTIQSAFSDFSPFSFRVDDEIKLFLKSLKPKKRDLVRLYTAVQEGLAMIKQKEEDGRIFTPLSDGKTIGDFYAEQVEQIGALIELKLDESEQQFVKDTLIPHLDNKTMSKHRWRYAFDTMPVKRWIVKRAHELGYQAALHGEYDSRVGSYNSRSENKIERIGKKYQWIALHEILAYTADNYLIREGYGENSQFAYYQGPWQKYLRDVDPVFITRNPGKDDDEEDEEDTLGIVEPEASWWTPDPYTYWNQPNADWVLNTQDMPDPTSILLRRDEQGEEWLYLHLNVYYNEPKPVGADKYDRLKKDIWYGFQAYLVKKSTKKPVVKWLEGQNFFGRWMPESHSLSGLYNRESYWSPASKYYQEEQKVWERLDGSKHQVILATGEAVGELGDDKSGAHFNYHMPCQTIFEGMQLQYAPQDGDFRNAAGEIVVTNSNPRGVLVRKKELLAFLEASGLEMVWTLLGEKNVWSSHSKTQEVYLKAISGVYALNEGGKLAGNFRILDRR